MINLHSNITVSKHRHKTHTANAYSTHYISLLYITNLHHKATSYSNIYKTVINLQCSGLTIMNATYNYNKLTLFARPCQYN